MDSIAKSVFYKQTGKKNMNKIISADGYTVREAFAITAKASDLLKQNSTISANTEDAFYVYSFQNGLPGYVIVSADDRLPEILAFSDKEHFFANNMSDAMRDMLQAYSDLLDKTKTKNVQESSQYENTSVEPLLGKISFNQFTPYNDKCPVYEGGKTVTGCLATAMAQIMVYHKYPERMLGDKISYTTKTLGIPVEWDCASTVFDWNNILDTYTEYTPEYSGEIPTTLAHHISFTDMEQWDEYYGYVKIHNFANISDETLNITVQFVLADSQGNLIQPVGNIIDDITDFKQGWSYPFIYLKHSIPSDLPDGTYRLYVGTKKNNFSDWSVAKQKDGSINYLTVIKNGTEYMIENNTFSCGYSDLQAEAVATLCAACGAATEMDYTPIGSGASNTNCAFGLYDYMGYDDSMSFAPNSYFTESGWIEYIQEELQTSRPIYCCGVTENNGAHAFIIDGYKYIDGTPYFHVNWGWNGQNDGYFLLNLMDPTLENSHDHNYGYNLDLTLGIKPKDNIDDGFLFGVKSQSVETPNVNVNERLTLTTSGLANLSVLTFSGKLQLYAVDEMQNEFLIGTYYSYKDWQPRGGYGILTKSMYVPSTIPTGDYTLHLRAVADESSVERTVLAPSFPTIHINSSTSIEKLSKEICHDKYAVKYDLSGKQIKNERGHNVYITNGKKYTGKASR